MSTLGQITNSEYDLMGAMTEDELLGLLEKAPVQERKNFLRRLKGRKENAGAGRNDSRSEFERRIYMMPKEIQDGLANKTLQAVDAAYYATKNVSNNKIIKMLKDDDTKIVAISSISGGKLEKGNIMLLAGIILLASVGVAKAEEGKYDILPDVLLNGEFEFKANGTTLVPITSNEVFNTVGTTRQKGYYKLDNPKVIFDQQAMELNVEWGSNAPDNTFMKAMLVGTAVIKY
ncbi:MAG TPA: hypothetical protein VIH57_23805 [Bacteroidales bacterium]